MPVQVLSVQGHLGDAGFQLCLPVGDTWNGTLVVWAPGGDGEVHSRDGTVRKAVLHQGFAYATTDYGIDGPWTGEEGKRFHFAESPARLVQLTRFAEAKIAAQLGASQTVVRRTYLSGFSAGGLWTRYLVERRPGLYDGGLSMSGANSMYTAYRAVSEWLRHWDARPSGEPPHPAMLGTEVTLAGGFSFEVGLEPETRPRWKQYARGWRYIMRLVITDADPEYDPNEDDSLSAKEVKRWDPAERPARVRRTLHRASVTGQLHRPMILSAGLMDFVGAPSHARSYQRLVAQKVGPGRTRLYLKPRTGHSVDAFYQEDEGRPAGFIPAALAALRQWAEQGIRPDTIAGLSPVQ